MVRSDESEGPPGGGGGRCSTAPSYKCYSRANAVILTPATANFGCKMYVEDTNLNNPDADDILDTQHKQATMMWPGYSWLMTALNRDTSVKI
jgi:hypothetical protein